MSNKEISVNFSKPAFHDVKLCFLKGIHLVDNYLCAGQKQRIVTIGQIGKLCFNASEISKQVFQPITLGASPSFQKWDVILITPRNCLVNFCRGRCKLPYAEQGMFYVNRNSIFLKLYCQLHSHPISSFERFLVGICFLYLV